MSNWPKAHGVQLNEKHALATAFFFVAPSILKVQKATGTTSRGLMTAVFLQHTLNQSADCTQEESSKIAPILLFRKNSTLEKNTKITVCTSNL